MKKSITTLCAAAIVLMAGSQVFAAGNTVVVWGHPLEGKSGLVFEIMALTTKWHAFQSEFWNKQLEHLVVMETIIVVYDARVERFISANMDNLAKTTFPAVKAST